MGVRQGDGLAAQGISIEDVIPAEVHGFAVRVGIGPYPADQPRSHRRAVYAELTPISPRTIERMRRAGRERIIGTVPLTAHGARLVTDDPHGRPAELIARRALAEASRLARLVNQA